jgi:probable phosphoglycerate mutase
MPIAAVYARPMQRTDDRAAIVARPHDLPIVGDVDLHEIDHGRWEQLHRDDVQERFPEEYRAWVEDPFTCAPPGSESGAQLLSRALPAIRRIVAAHEGKALLVVSHQARFGSSSRACSALICAAIATASTSRWPRSISSISRARRRRDFTLFNDVSHYAETFWRSSEGTKGRDCTEGSRAKAHPLGEEAPRAARRE